MKARKKKPNLKLASLNGKTWNDLRAETPAIFNLAGKLQKSALLRQVLAEALQKCAQNHKG